MKISFDLQWQPVGDNMLWDAVEKAEHDENYTFAYRLGNEITIYKQCQFESSTALCTCGFRRYTRVGYFKNKQIQELKEHLETSRLPHHSITITHKILGNKQ